MEETGSSKTLIKIHRNMRSHIPECYVIFTGFGMQRLYYKKTKLSLNNIRDLQ
jgi:hypothetical protein